MKTTCRTRRDSVEVQEAPEQLIQQGRIDPTRQDRCQKVVLTP
ncbi:hypothetical protein [Streptomyces sp. NPDC003697]